MSDSAGPRVHRTLSDVSAACEDARRRGSLGFVPTMGALHEGHLSLVHAAREACTTVAVSLFVNPLQFGAGEDFEAYPRDEAGDAERLAEAGADLLLILTPEEMYPPGFTTRVDLTSLVHVFEGAARPGHFSGVCTVVAKLLNLVRPTASFFGRKDYQQTVVVRRMVADLALPGDVVVCDTVRAADGLALSSRNAYLDAAERRQGLGLVNALQHVEALFAGGEDDVTRLEQALRERLQEAVGAAPDYAAIVDPDDLSTPARARPGDVALVAAPVGPARLLDNHVLGARLGPFATSP